MPKKPRDFTRHFFFLEKEKPCFFDQAFFSKETSMAQRDTHEHENVFSYQRLWLANQKVKESLRDDTRGLSQVIAVIMMIAVVTIIAAMVAGFAYGVIGEVSEVPCTALVEEGVGGGTNVTVTIIHYGGDFVSGAFTTVPCTELGDKWQNLELKYNGAKVSSSTANSRGLDGVNATTVWPDDFRWRCIEDTVQKVKDG